MEVINFHNELEQRMLHLQRLRQIKPHVDTSTPSSLGLKHLATRPKKQQLIDDRNETIAKENRKLMENMTKLMTEKKPSENRIKISSLNETERKLNIEKINNENRLFLERLKKTGPVVKAAKLESEYETHQKYVKVLMRRQLKPLPHLLKNMSVFKNMKVQQQQLKSPKLFDESSSTFDTNSYLSHHQSLSQGEDKGGLPPLSLSEFRKQIISSKRAPNSLPNSLPRIP